MDSLKERASTRIQEMDLIGGECSYANTTRCRRHCPLQRLVSILIWQGPFCAHDALNLSAVIYQRFY